MSPNLLGATYNTSRTDNVPQRPEHNKFRLEMPIYARRTGITGDISQTPENPNTNDRSSRESVGDKLYELSPTMTETNILMPHNMGINMQDTQPWNDIPITTRKGQFRALMMYLEQIMDEYRHYDPNNIRAFIAKRMDKLLEDARNLTGMKNLNRDISSPPISQGARAQEEGSLEENGIPIDENYYSPLVYAVQQSYERAELSTNNGQSEVTSHFQRQIAMGELRTPTYNMERKTNELGGGSEQQGGEHGGNVYSILSHQISTVSERPTSETEANASEGVHHPQRLSMEVVQATDSNERGGSNVRQQCRLELANRSEAEMEGEGSRQGSHHTLLSTVCATDEHDKGKAEPLRFSSRNGLPSPVEDPEAVSVTQEVDMGQEEEAGLRQETWWNLNRLDRGDPVKLGEGLVAATKQWMTTQGINGPYAPSVRREAVAHILSMQQGYRFYRLAGDGNCSFAGLSAQIVGGVGHAACLRKLLFEMIVEERGILRRKAQPLSADDRTWDCVLETGEQQVKHEGTTIEGTVMGLLAERLKVNIGWLYGGGTEGEEYFNEFYTHGDADDCSWPVVRLFQTTPGHVDAVFEAEHDSEGSARLRCLGWACPGCKATEPRSVQLAPSRVALDAIEPCKEGAVGADLIEVEVLKTLMVYTEWSAESNLGKGVARIMADKAVREQVVLTSHIEPALPLLEGLLERRTESSLGTWLSCNGSVVRAPGGGGADDHSLGVQLPEGMLEADGIQLFSNRLGVSDGEQAKALRAKCWSKQQLQLLARHGYTAYEAVLPLGGDGTQDHRAWLAGALWRAGLEPADAALLHVTASWMVKSGGRAGCVVLARSRKGGTPPPVAVCAGEGGGALLSSTPPLCEADHPRIPAGSAGHG